MDKEDDIIWRPFGIETPEEIARYDTLYEGVTPWMKGPLWNWMIYQLDEEQSENDSEFNDSLVERLFQQLRIPLLTFGEGNFSSALFTLCESNQLLPAIDFILAFSDDADADSLQRILDRSGSAWTIGNRIEGYKGLVRRVPKGVQLAADSIMQGSENAGIHLAHAWESLYGMNPDPSKAYSEAIKAVEAATIPIICPNDKMATLGKVINIIQNQNWELSLRKSPKNLTSNIILLDMLRTLWEGQLDRHDSGDTNAPRSVNESEAAVAVGLAVTLVHWFHSGLVIHE